MHFGANCLLKVKPTLTEEQRTAIAGELEEMIVGWRQLRGGVAVFISGSR